MILQSCSASKDFSGFFWSYIGPDVGNNKNHYSQKNKNFQHIINDKV